MKTAVFSTKPYDRDFLTAANVNAKHELVFFEARLSPQTCRLAEGFPAVCAFVNDELDEGMIRCLQNDGTKMIALRCAGFNNVDLTAAGKHGMTVARVPAYSPRSIAEFAVGLMLSLSRKIHRAFVKTREGDFRLEGLLGFDLHCHTVGVVGTGKIGAGTAKILLGFGCRVLANDVFENEELKKLGVKYVSRDELFQRSDVISLHCPLLPDTKHLINDQSLATMKNGVMIVNTSRGELVNTEAVIGGLKSGKIGSLAMDVYEEEAEFFYEDFSFRVIQDDTLARILTFPNVIVTGHQAFFTVEAMQAIAKETIDNITAFEQGKQPPGLVNLNMVKPKA